MQRTIQHSKCSKKKQIEIPWHKPMEILNHLFRGSASTLREKTLNILFIHSSNCI